MSTPHKSSSALTLVVLVLLAAALASLVAGFSGAVFGWFGQVFMLTILIPIGLLATNYRYAFYALIFLTPFAGANFIPKVGPLSIVNLLLMGVISLLAIRMILRRMVGKSSFLLVPKEFLIYYVVPITVGFLIGSMHLHEIAPQHLGEGGRSASQSFYWVSTYFKGMLFAVCGIALGSVVWEYDNAKQLIVAALLSAVVYVLVTTAIFVVSPSSLEDAVASRQMFSSTGRHANGVGAMLLPMLGAALFMRDVAGTKTAKLGLFLVILILFSGILLTGSRGAFLGLVVVVGVYVVTRRMFRSLLLVIALAVGAAFVAPEAITHRLTMGLDQATQSGGNLATQDERLTSGRLYLATQLLPEVVKSPLIGRGMGSTIWSDYAKNGGPIGHPHNLYLTILLDMGILGLLLVCVFAKFVVRSLHSISRNERIDPFVRAYFGGSVAGFFGYLIFGLSGGYPYPQIEQWFIWVSIGIAIGVSARNSLPSKNNAVSSGSKGIATPFSATWRP